MELYDKIVDKNLLVRRINITANKVVNESDIDKSNDYEQLDLFTDYAEKEKIEKLTNIDKQKEKELQHTIIDIKKKYGKNSILKGMNFEDGGTMRERNEQIGGHKE